MADQLARIRFTTRAERDLRKLQRQDLERVRQVVRQLAAGAENLDVKAVQGRPPWLRLRVGDHRVLYRPLDDAEASDASAGWLIARVIARRELERAVGTLGS